MKEKKDNKEDFIVLFASSKVRKTEHSENTELSNVQIVIFSRKTLLFIVFEA